MDQEPYLPCTTAITADASLPAEEVLHFRDLALLRVDNALGKLPSAGILSIAELSLGHRDSPLMMADHHLQEHPVERAAAGLPELLHLAPGHHAGHGTVHLPHHVALSHASHRTVSRGHRGVPSAQESTQLIDFGLLLGLDADSEVFDLR